MLRPTTWPVEKRGSSTVNVSGSRMTCSASSRGVTSQPPSAGSQDTGSCSRRRASSGCGSASSSSVVAAAPMGKLVSPIRSGQQPRASGVLQRLRDLPLRQFGAELPVRLVAREQHHDRECAAFAELGAQPAGPAEMADEADHLAAAVGALALDEIARRGVDRGGAVQLAEHAVLGNPEAHLFEIVSARAASGSSSSTELRKVSSAGFTAKLSQIASTSSSRERKCW